MSAVPKGFGELLVDSRNIESYKDQRYQRSLAQCSSDLLLMLQAHLAHLRK